MYIKHSVQCPNTGYDAMLAKKCSLYSIGTTGILGLPLWLSGKEPACQWRRCRFDPWVRKIPWRSKWQPTPVFLPGKSHGQSSLQNYSPWGCKEPDTTEQVTTTTNSIHINFFSSKRRWWKWSQLLKNLSAWSVVALFATKDFHFEFCLCSFLGSLLFFPIDFFLKSSAFSLENVGSMHFPYNVIPSERRETVPHFRVFSSHPSASPDFKVWATHSPRYVQRTAIFPDLFQSVL